MSTRVAALLTGTFLLASQAGCDLDILLHELDSPGVIVERPCPDCYDTVYVEDTVYVQDTYVEEVWVEDIGYDEYYLDGWVEEPYYYDEDAYYDSDDYDAGYYDESYEGEYDYDDEYYEDSDEDED